MKNTNGVSKILMSALLASIVLGTSAVTVANADDANYDSYGQITFISDDAATLPQNPYDPNPDNPVKPVNPDGTDPNPGTPGPLSIDFASAFDFGTQKIAYDGKAHTYNAAAQEFQKPENGDDFFAPGENGQAGGPTGQALYNKSPLYVQVTDKRGDENRGWNLTAEVSTFENSGNTLEGAQINITNVNALTFAGTDAGIAPGADAAITLAPDAGAAHVMGATTDADAPNNGFGTWLAVFGNGDSLQVEKDANGDDRVTDTDVQLAVPQDTVTDDGQYQATVTWTLNDAVAED